ncbi:MAG: biopolymer transporter ExbD [Gammaproteobacteria bacterium]|nr:biopolymer transporter ExbD [Gammaproteobacteria bacterium]
MKQQSRRMKRMERARSRAVPALNLTSLMDVFTILVFFLLNTSGSAEMQPPSSLKLPDSVAEQKPEKSTVVMITPTDIWLNERVVASTVEVMASTAEDPVIEPLRVALEEEAARLVLPADDSGAKRNINIMGDREIQFKVLKKIMATSTVAGYDKISLAVSQKAVQ